MNEYAVHEMLDGSVEFISDGSDGLYAYAIFIVVFDVLYLVSQIRK